MKAMCISANCAIVVYDKQNFKKYRLIIAGIAENRKFSPSTEVFSQRLGTMLLQENKESLEQFT